MTKFYLLPILSTLALLLLTGYGGGPATLLNNHYIGAPGGAGSTCGNCHSSGGYGAVSADIRVFEAGSSTQVTSWVKGRLYDVEVEMMHQIGAPMRYGFQCVVFEGGTSNQIGTLLNPDSNAKIVNLLTGIQVVEHNGFSSSPVFKFQWQAPTTFGGLFTPVQFFAGGIVGNGNGQITGDTGMSNPASISLSEDTTLPVELTDFNAKQQHLEVLLNWSTATETENSHFVIEHANKSLDFIEIGKIDGAGTTSETSEYRFTHESPMIGKDNYYRLKQVGVDGTFSYSDLVTVALESRVEQIAVFPIPAVDEVTVLVNIKNTDTYLNTITSLSGKIEYAEELSLSAGEQPIQLDLTQLPAGHYIFNLSNSKTGFSTSIIKF